MEDDKVWRSEIPSNFHMEASLWGPPIDINRTFCMKPEIGISKREWPRGNLNMEGGVLHLIKCFCIRQCSIFFVLSMHFSITGNTDKKRR